MARRRSSAVAGLKTKGAATRRNREASGVAAFSFIASRPVVPKSSVGRPARVRLSQPGVRPYRAARRSPGSWRRAMASWDGSMRPVMAAKPRAPRSPPVRVRMVSARRSISGRGVELAAMATPKAASTTGAAASSRRILFSFAVQSILAKQSAPKPGRHPTIVQIARQAGRFSGGKARFGQGPTSCRFESPGDLDTFPQPGRTLRQAWLQSLRLLELLSVQCVR